MQSVMIRSGQQLRLWDELEILVGHGERAGKYRARVEDFVNGGIVIDKPEFVEGGTLLRNGAEVLVAVCRDDAVYEFRSRIRQASGGQRERYFLLPPRNVRRVQRRQFARVEVYERLKYARINPTPEWQQYEERSNWHDSHTIDISGGGALIAVPEPLKTRDLLLVKFELFAELSLPPIVVAICRRTFRRDEQWLAGIEFLTERRLRQYFRDEELCRLPDRVRGFDGRAQDLLVNFVFRKQIQMRNKGLL